MKLSELLLIGVLMLPLFACEDPDTSVETKADIQLFIPLSSTELKSLEVEGGYLFEGETTFCIANKDNSIYCPGNILHVTSGENATLTLPVFEGELSMLSFEWGFGTLGSDDFEMQSPVPLTLESMSGASAIVIDLDEVLLPLVNRMDSEPNTLLKIVITGNSNIRISSVAQMEIPLIVEHEVLTPRFTL